MPSADVFLPDAEQRMAAAVHESGHVVAHLAGGLRVHQVEINETLGGKVVIDEFLDAEHMPAYLVGCLAGLEAEAYWLESRWSYPLRVARREARSGACDDLLNFREFSKYVGVDFLYVRRKARSLVVHHWHSIEKFSLLLCQRGSVSESEIREYRLDLMG